MSRSTGSRTITVAAVLVAALALLTTPAQASARTAPAKPATGSIVLTFGPSYVQQMFKAGVFIYGSSDVSVRMSNSTALSAIVPLNGASTSTPTTLIQVDGEAGGIDFFNGPGEATAGIAGLAIRRTGTTGMITGRVIGPYSAEAGQFDETLPVFSLSAVRSTRSNSGWKMTAKMTLTDRGATTLNTLLKTNFFRGGTPVGSFNADVNAG